MMRPAARRLGGFGALATSLPLTGPVMAAGAIEGATPTRPTNWTAIVMSFAFALFTLAITRWAASKTKSAADFYTAGGGITASISARSPGRPAPRRRPVARRLWLGCVPWRVVPAAAPRDRL
jgi:hypothetical protein